MWKMYWYIQRVYSSCVENVFQRQLINLISITHRHT